MGEFVGWRACRKSSSSLISETIRDRAPTPVQFREVRPQALTEIQINYVPIAALRGLRGRTCEVVLEVNAFCENRGFHHYKNFDLAG
jgi:hypothetical protein